MTHDLCGVHDLPHGDEDLSGEVVLEHGGVEGARALVFLCMVIDSTLSKQKESRPKSTTSQSLVLMIINNK